MKIVQSFIDDERGVTFTLGYILDIMIMGVLLAGIIMGVSGFVDSNHSQAVQYQTDVISSQVSDRITSIDNLDTPRQQTNLTISLDTPERIIGKQYFVRLVDPPSDNPYVAVHVPKTDTTQKTTLNINADVVESSVSGSNVYVKIVDKPGENPEISLVASDEGGT